MSNPYDAYIKEAAAKYGVDPKLIKAMMQQESSNDPYAKSHKGASGLMQLMPATARSLGVTNIYDPKQNIDAGTKYISQQLKTHKGNVPLALASYNAGPNAVKKYGGIPPFSETQAYVKKVMGFYNGSDTVDVGAAATAGGDTGNLFGGIVRSLLLLFVIIVGILFFMQAFPDADPTKLPIVRTVV